MTPEPPSRPRPGPPSEPPANGASRADGAAAEQDALFESLLIAYDEALARGEARTPDERLVPPELQPRLQAALECLSLLARSRPAEADAPTGSLPGGPSDWGPVQQNIGRFRVLRELGRGGHGVVFLAADPRLGRLVALKVPRPEVLVTRELHQRFLREARAASALDHPNLVPIHEAGDDGPLCYIAAAYCEGPTLASWLKQQSSLLTYPEAAQLIAVLADAVGHAHARGILHRDIKPANVMLAPADLPQSGGAPSGAAPPLGSVPLFSTPTTPRLTDFGLAKLVDEEAGDNTRAGTMLGTPAYMAPEQADGRTADVSAATDVYALGAMLYELLVGRPPFRGANDLETVRLVSAAEVVAPARLRPGVPRDLEAICLRALERQPRARYQTAAALADDLRRFLGSRPTAARPLGAARRAVKWCRRRPLAAALVAVLAAVAVAGPFVALRQSLLAENEAIALLAAKEATALEAAARHDLELKATELKLASDDLRAHLYRARMDLALQAWHEGNVTRLLALLEENRPGINEQDLRGFEWYHLWRCCHDYRWRVADVADAIQRIKISPDGRWIAVIQVTNKSVGIYSAETGSLKHTLSSEYILYTCLDFSPDSELLVYSDGTEKSLVVVEVASGKRVVALPSDSAFGCAAFAPDGKTLATIAMDGATTLWNTDTWQPAMSWKGPDQGAALENLAWSSDGTRLLSITRFNSVKGVVRVWDPATGDLTRTWEGPWGGISDRMAVSPDGHSLAYIVKSAVHVWDDRMSEETPPLVSDLHGAVHLAYAPNGHLAVCLNDGTIQFLDPAARRLIETVKGHVKHVRSLSFSADGRTWASSAIRPAREMLIWDADTPRAYQTFRAEQTTSGRCAIARSGLMLTSSGNDSVNLWEAFNGKLSKTLTLAGSNSPHGKILALAVSDDEKIAAGGYSGGMTLWDLPSGAVRAQWSWAGARPAMLAFSPRGDFLAAGGVGAEQSGNIALWHVDSGEPHRTLAGHPQIFRKPTGEVASVNESQAGGITALAFSPDGKTLATAAEWRVRLWNVASGELERELVEHGGHIHAVAFSPDGALLASAGVDGNVKLWRIRTGELMDTLSEGGALVSVAFSPRGDLLAFGSAKGVRLWHLGTRELCGTLDAGGPYFGRLDFAANGTLLLGGESDGTVHIWRSATDAAATRRK